MDFIIIVVAAVVFWWPEVATTAVSQPIFFVIYAFREFLFVFLYVCMYATRASLPNAADLQDSCAYGRFDNRRSQ